MDEAVRPGGARTRVVVLDDYQHVALESGPWDRLAGRCDVETLSEHIPDTDDLVAALERRRRWSSRCANAPASTPSGSTGCPTCASS